MKATGAEYGERRQRIEEWFALHPRTPLPDSAGIAALRREIDEVIEDFAAKCAELKAQVAHLGSPE